MILKHVRVKQTCIEFSNKSGTVIHERYINNNAIYTVMHHPGIYREYFDFELEVISLPKEVNMLHIKDTSLTYAYNVI